MSIWWNSLHRDQHILLFWFAGFLISVTVVMFCTFKEFYENYVEFIKGDRKHEPALVEDNEAILPMGLACAVWPVLWIWAFFAGTVNDGPFKFLRYINPKHLVKLYAIKRYKALAITSPNAKVRELLK